MNNQLQQFVAKLYELDNVINADEAGPIIERYLPDVLASKDLLTGFDLVADVTEPYTKHNLYVSQGVQKWSIQVLLWQPNAKTDIHNHKCWCTFGMYQGQMVEEIFDKNTNLIEEKNYKVGNYASMTPSGTDIHRMVNKSGKPAISLHFYGINGHRQNSIYNIFN